MKTILFAFLFIIGLVNYSKSQVTFPYEMQQAIDFYRTNKFIAESKNSSANSGIEGSPYLEDEFVKGSIFTIQRQQYVDIPLRYNIYNDDLEFKTPTDEIQALATPGILEKAVFGNTQIVYSSFELVNKIKKGFFIVLEEGKVSLYAKPGIMFREATLPGAYKEAEPAKFVRKPDEYYLRIGQEPAKLIGSKKELETAFPDNQDKIKSYISKNKTKVNKPENLIELVKYYNSL